MRLLIIPKLPPIKKTENNVATETKEEYICTTKL